MATTARNAQLGRVPLDTLGNRLLLMRHELGLTVEEISARCDIAPATWSTWENGARPRDREEVVRKIASGTGYDRNWIMWGNDAFDPHPAPGGNSGGADGTPGSDANRRLAHMASGLPVGDVLCGVIAS